MGNKQVSGISLKSTLNGSYHNGNFIWSGAMNICWQTLESQIIKSPFTLKVNTELAKKMVKNFQKSAFSNKDLTEDSYYTKAGFGQQALNTINKECRQKFPNKSFTDLNIPLKDEDIISYAYFVKQVQYLTPFSVKPRLGWNRQSFVKGFEAKQSSHFDSIRVCKYSENNDFVIKLLLKQQNQELFIVKGYVKLLPQQIVSLVNDHANVEGRLRDEQKFEMPMIEMNIKREYKELINAQCLNKGFTQYRIGHMFEGIKFKMDEVGAKVESEGVVWNLKMGVLNERSFIVDRPFWVVMRQKGCHPYFITQINNTEFMTKTE